MAFYSVMVHDAEGKGDQPYLDAIAESKLDELLATRKIIQQGQGHNLILDSWVANNLWHFFPDAPDVPNELDLGAVGVQATMSNVSLLTTDSEPTYQEYSRSSCANLTNVSGQVASNVTKRVWNNISELPVNYTVADGREAIAIELRYLWLPSNGDYVNIRSAAMFHRSDADLTSSGTTWCAIRVSRVRFKDSVGDPVTYNKTENQSFLLRVITTWATF